MPGLLLQLAPAAIRKAPNGEHAEALAEALPRETQGLDGEEKM
jgi:hypothetical protein